MSLFHTVIFCLLGVVIFWVLIILLVRLDRSRYSSNIEQNPKKLGKSFKDSNVISNISPDMRTQDLTSKKSTKGKRLYGRECKQIKTVKK